MKDFEIDLLEGWKHPHAQYYKSWDLASRLAGFATGLHRSQKYEVRTDRAFSEQKFYLNNKVRGFNNVDRALRRHKAC